MVTRTETAVAPSWRTLPNALSLLRLFVALPLVASIRLEAPEIATACLAFAVGTDFLDGHFARRRGESSALGGLIDHAVDATFVTAGLAALAARGDVPAALPPLIALAFFQYAASARPRAGVPLRGSALGRWNGIAYYALLATPLARDALALAWPSAALIHAFGWCLAATTVVSILLRMRG
jgi:phosphatidylglycerophosphate synthase